MNDQRSHPTAAEKLDSLATVDYLGARAKRADLAEFYRLLAMVPDTAPDEGDEWPFTPEKTPVKSS